MVGVRIKKQTKNPIDLQMLAADAYHAKQVADAAAERWEASKADLAQALTNEQQKSVTAVLSDGQRVKATYTRGKRIDYDEAMLKKKLGAKLWKKVSKAVLDKDALKEHLEGHPDHITDVAQCAEEVLFKPSIKFTPIKERK